MLFRRGGAGLVVFALAGAFGSCGDDSVDDGPPEEAGPQARFELGEGLPRFLDVPFPTDAYLDADGTLVDIEGLDAMIPAASETVRNALSRMQGFGRNSGAIFRIDRPSETDETGAPLDALVDASSLPAAPEDCTTETASVLLVDLEATGDEPVLLPCRAAYQDDRPLGSSTRPSLVVLPARGVVLKGGHRYAAVLTSHLTADGGKPVEPSERFAALRDGTRNGALDELYGNAVDEIASKVSFLSDKTRIVAATPFTTQATTEELFELRDRIGSLPPPPILWDEASVAPMYPGFFTKEPTPASTATLAEWLGTPAKLQDGTDDPAADQATGHGHDALLAIATGVFEAPSFLQEREDGYSDPDHRTFARDADGKPILDPENPTSKVWVSIAIPDRPMPATGYPVVVLQHGLQGDRSFLLTMANTFAKEGYATVAIEAVTFGARSAIEDFHVDEISRFPWSEEAGSYAGPDGLVDLNATAIALFGELVNFSASRDQFRQSVLDFGTLAEILADPAIDLGPLADLVPGLALDGDRLGYIGDSFGAVVGAIVAAVDPRYRAMILNVAGGGILVEMVSNGPLLATAIGSLGGLTFNMVKDRLDWRHPLVSLLQPVLDGADPLSYTDHYVRDPVVVEPTGAPKSVVIIEVIFDELVANEGTEALAKAAGIPLAAPSVGPNGGVELDEVQPEGGVIRDAPAEGHTVVVVQASPATHGANLYGARGLRRYEPPFVRDELGTFPSLPELVEVQQPYLGLQRMAVRFMRTAFEDAVPEVADFPEPVHDFDQDGVPDTEDPLPFDPSG